MCEDDAETPELSSFADESDSDGSEESSRDSLEETAPRVDVASVVDTAVERPRAERIELGVELLTVVDEEQLALPEAVSRLETITNDPTVTREILDAAETRGVIDRDGATIRRRVRGPTVEFERHVVRRDGEYDCRRCGKSLSTGHFVQFETGEIGPFGSSCVRTVIGRD